jgi:alpha-L-fucosidase
VDGDETTRWGAAADARSGWLEVDLERPMLVGQAVIKELGYHRTQQFAIERKDGDVWRELAKGTTIAGTKVVGFKPVTAQYIRLNIQKANEVPTIEEFELYPPGTVKMP